MDGELKAKIKAALDAKIDARLAGPREDYAEVVGIEEATDAILSAIQGEAQPVACLSEMLQADNARMRAAGCTLSEAAVQVIRDYDGLHRLSKAVAGWSEAIAAEGGRGERFAHPASEQAGEVERLRGALDRARKFIDACAIEGEMTPNDGAENPCELVLAIDAALNPGGQS